MLLQIKDVDVSKNTNDKMATISYRTKNRISGTASDTSQQKS